MSYERMIALRYLDVRRLGVTAGVVLVSLVVLTMTILNALSHFSGAGELGWFDKLSFAAPVIVIAIGWWLLSRQGVRGNVAVITTISVCGVTIGVMVLLTVISVMNGFSQDIRNRILGTHGHLKITTRGYPEWRDVVERLKQQPGIRSVTPRSEAMVLMETAFGGRPVPIQMWCVDPVEETQSGNIADSVVAGSIHSLEPPEDPAADRERVSVTERLRRERESRSARPIILGSELARNLFGYRTHFDDYLGSRVNVTFPEFSHGLAAPLPKVGVYEVVGIWRSGMYEYDAGYAFVSLEGALRFLGRDSADSVHLMLDNSEVRASERTLLELLGVLWEATGVHFSGYTWMQLNEPFFRALQIEKTLIFVIQVLVVLVAAFNIASTLIMMVMSKTRDIGILLALGAEQAGIRRIFTYMGAGVGIAGTMVGCLLAWLLCLWLRQVKVVLPPEVYYVPTLPVVMRWTDFAIVAVCSCLICFFAALFPSRQAARLQPVEALRYD